MDEICFSNWYLTRMWLLGLHVLYILKMEPIFFDFIWSLCRNIFSNKRHLAIEISKMYFKDILFQRVLSISVASVSTPCSSVSTVNFEHVNGGWESHIRAICTQCQGLYSNHLPYFSGTKIKLSSTLTEISHNWVNFTLTVRHSKQLEPSGMVKFW